MVDMRIPADIRVSVYIAVALGFSRRLLRKVLVPSGTRLFREVVGKERKISLCVDHEGLGLRGYVGGPWVIGGMEELYRAIEIAGAWEGRLPENMSLAVVCGDCSDKMGLCRFMELSRLGDDKEFFARAAVEGCRVDIMNMLGE